VVRLDSGAGWNQSSISITVAEPLCSTRRLSAGGRKKSRCSRPSPQTDALIAARNPGTRRAEGRRNAQARPTIAARARRTGCFTRAVCLWPPAQRHAARPLQAHCTRRPLVDLHRSRLPARQRPCWCWPAISTARPLAALAAKHFGQLEGRRPSASPRVGHRGAEFAGPTGHRDRLCPRPGQAAAVLVTPQRPPAITGAARSGQVTNSGCSGGGYSSRHQPGDPHQGRGLSYGGRQPPRRAAARPAPMLASVQTKQRIAPAEVGRAAWQAEVRPAHRKRRCRPTKLAARKTTLIGAFSRSVETTAGLARRGDARFVVIRRCGPDDLGQAHRRARGP